MAMPCERTRSIVQTCELLRELSRDQTLKNLFVSRQKASCGITQNHGDLWDRFH